MTTIIETLFPPEKDPFMWDDQKKMVQIEARELEWLRQQAATNPSRGQIVSGWSYLDREKSDPEYHEFQQLVDGKKFWDENTAKTAINNWIKFRQLLEAIAEEYHLAFNENVPSDYSTRYEFLIDIEDGAILVEWKSSWEDQVSVPHSEGDFYLPTELLWSDWKKICRDKIAEREAEAKVKEEVARQEWENRNKEYLETDYRRAKELVENYEKNNSASKDVDWKHHTEMDE